MKTISGSKRGQVTLFIVLGIVLVIAVAVGIFLRKEISQSIQDVKISSNAALQQKVEEVKPFVQDCLESVTEDAVLRIIAKGGYSKPKKSVEYNYYNVPIYFDKGKETVPAMQDIANEIAFAARDNIVSCANFNAVNLPVKALKRPEAAVSIGKKAVAVELDWPLQVVSGEDSVTISEFSAEVKADIFYPYEHAIELYNKQKVIKVLSLIDLARLAKQRDFILHFDMAGNDAMVYLLTFNKTIIKREPLVYTFGIIREKPKAGESRSLVAGANTAGAVPAGARAA